MQHLKETWMREVEEVVDDQTQPLATQSNADDDEQFDNENESHAPATVSSNLADDYTLDPSSVLVENMLAPSTFDDDTVNFEYDTYGIGTFDLPCASDVMSQATGLSSFYPHIAHDNVFFDESCQQQQQSALFNEESASACQVWMQIQ
jgi:hypothetical protein